MIRLCLLVLAASVSWGAVGVLDEAALDAMTPAQQERLRADMKAKDLDELRAKVRALSQAYSVQVSPNIKRPAAGFPRPGVAAGLKPGARRAVAAKLGAKSDAELEEKLALEKVTGVSTVSGGEQKEGACAATPPKAWSGRKEWTWTARDAKGRHRFAVGRGLSRANPRMAEHTARQDALAVYNDAFGRHDVSFEESSRGIGRVLKIETRPDGPAPVQLAVAAADDGADVRVLVCLTLP